MKKKLKSLLHWHRAEYSNNVILYASPRGGSTWLTEIVAALPRFWPIHEPFNVRTKFVKENLEIDDFPSLYAASNQAKISDYYNDLFHGKHSELKLRPGNRFYRPYTTRIVIKQNQALLNRINWVVDEFNVRAIHLVRHPIAVALSREELPLLAGFKACDLRKCFTVEQLALADQIIADGSHLEKGIIAWCLHHAPALWAHRGDTLLLSYEHCVLEPETVLRNLLDFLGEDGDLQKMKDLAKRPSGVIHKSDVKTQKLLHSGQGRNGIIDKWRSKVDPSTEAQLLQILKVFGVDIYHTASSIPSAWRESEFNGNQHIRTES